MGLPWLPLIKQIVNFNEKQGVGLSHLLNERNQKRVNTSRVRADRAQLDPPLGHITTFGGHPVSCAAALASLDILIDQKLIENADEKAQIFIEKLSKHKAVKAIRADGLFMAVEIGSFENILKLMKIALMNGIVLDWFLFCNTAFRIAPPLSITKEECNEAVDLLLKSLDEII